MSCATLVAHWRKGFQFLHTCAKTRPGFFFPVNAKNPYDGGRQEQNVASDMSGASTRRKDRGVSKTVSLNSIRDGVAVPEKSERLSSE